MQQHEYAGAPIKDNEVPHSELVKQAAAGDQYAFEALTQRYQGLLLRYINSYLRDYDQAHDVLQQVLLQLYLCLPTLTASESLKPWLLQVARHRCIDELRKRKMRQVMHFSDLERNTEEDTSPLADLPDPQPLPEEYAEYHDLQRTLWRAIQALPPVLRAVALLRCTEYLPFSQIGQTLHMPEGTAKTYFQRAKAQLRIALQPNR
jgi:RNA polymerase sigma factor (sigma-70 family)